MVELGGDGSRTQTQGAMHRQPICKFHIKTVVLLACLAVADASGQATQFPQVYYNSQGSGGFNLNVRTTANSSGSVLTSVPVDGRIGAESLTTNSGDAFYNWIRVCLPQTSSTDNNPDYGYMAASEFYMRIHESATSTNHATVNTASTPLGVRTTAGGTTYVTISGSNAYYGAGSIVARTGSTSSVSGSTWYQIHLPNNCSQATGWVNGLYLTIPAAPNFRVVGGRICDDAGSCAFLGNINGALISFSGGNGSTRSSSGFYQYKLTTNVTTSITCTASGFTTSTPTSYNHTASSHNYTRQFVMSNVSCTYSLSPNNNNSVPNGGGSYSVSVTAPASCAWTATESLSWVSITSGASGTGNGTVNYTVTSNGGSSRLGTMTIGGQSFQITQAGVCTYSLSPTSNLTIPVGGGSYSVGVSTQSGCAWTATESLSWVSITSGTSGTGSGTVNYTASINGGTARSGTLVIAGETFQLNQAGAPTLGYTMRVYNKPSSGIPITERLLATAVSGNPQPPPMKICADGTKSTIVKLQVNGGTVNMSDILFRMASGSPIPARYCTFQTADYESPVGIQRKATITHPTYLSETDSPYIQDTIIAYNLNNYNIPLVKMPVQVHRPPVVFVHGIWGEYGSFKAMDDSFKEHFGAENILTWRVNYKLTNARSFEVNALIVRDNIRNAVEEARNRLFSCGKVDVIAHSMGGILSRRWILNDDYGGEIRTLTTINTPNSGTQAADLLRSPYGLVTQQAMALLGHMPTNEGGVEDLKSTSPYFYGGYNLGDPGTLSIPALNYSSLSTIYDAAKKDWWPIHITLLMNPEFDGFPFFINGPEGLVSRLYNPFDGDPIVPLNSQQAGQNSIERGNVTHMEAKSNTENVEHIISNLGVNPTTSAFNHEGWQPMYLHLPWWLDVVTPGFAAPLWPDSVVIVQPTNGTTVSPGDVVTIVVDNSLSDHTYLAAAAGNSFEQTAMMDTSGIALSWNYTVPQAACGLWRVSCLSINAQGLASVDSVFLNVLPQASLDSVRFITDSLWISHGGVYALTVEGYYNDGIVRDITGVAGLGYLISDPQILTPVSGGLIGSQVGVSTITVTLNGHSDQMVFIVEQNPNVYQAAFQASDNIICGQGAILFTDVSGGSPISRQWQFPGGSPSTSSDLQPQITYSNTGNYSVTLITTWSDKVDTLVAPAYVVVANPPTIAIDPIGPTTVYEGTSVQLDATGSSGVVHYLWSSTDTTQVVVANTTGDYVVIGVDSLGCNASATTSIVVHPLLKVAPRAFLDGPYDVGEQMMHDSLRTHGLIPLTEPYTGLGYPHLGGGGESIVPAVLSVSGGNAIVDWVVLELRSGSNPVQVLQTRSGLIQRDGDIVGKDGVSPVGFSLPEGSYYITIRHRNHLGAMTSGAVFLSSTATVVDFTSASTSTYGTEARKSNGTYLTLWSGNTLWDNELKYTGSNNDRDPVLVRIGGTIPTNTVPGYYRDDVNLDGVVKYTGSGNDRDPILVNIGGTVPTQVRTEQLP